MVLLFMLIYRRGMSHTTSQDPLSRWRVEISLEVTFAILICFASIFGNVLIFCTTNKYSEMQTTTNIFIYNLALGQNSRQKFSTRRKRIHVLWKDSLMPKWHCRRSERKNGEQFQSLVMKVLTWMSRYASFKRTILPIARFLKVICTITWPARLKVSF